MTEHQQAKKSAESKSNIQTRTILPKHIPTSHPASIIQRARINPKSLTHTDVMYLQSTIGNRAVGRFLSEIGLVPSVAKLVQRQEIPEEEETCPSCVQRQKIPEKEEPLQGKMAETLQCQEIPGEKELLQSKMAETIQRQEIPEEEEPLQGKFAEPLKRQEIPEQEEEEPLQGKFENKPEQETCLSCSTLSVQLKKEDRTEIPDGLKTGVENLSDLSIAQGAGNVLQMVGEGYYTTIKKGHLRDNEHKSIANIPRGVKLHIEEGARTENFGIFNLNKKDHTWTHYLNKEGFVRDEILKLTPATIVHTSVTSPIPEPETSSSPMKSQAAVYRAASSQTDSEELPESPQMLTSRLMIQKGQVPQHIETAFESLGFYMHFTQLRSVLSIRESGLGHRSEQKSGSDQKPYLQGSDQKPYRQSSAMKIVPRRSGLGYVGGEFSEAEGGDKSNVYVVDTLRPENAVISGEAGEGTVVVLSRDQIPSPDPNYKKGSYFFSGFIPSASQYTEQSTSTEQTTRTGQAVPGTISLAIPLSSDDRIALAKFISAVIINKDTTPATPEQAEFLLMRKLVRRWRLRFEMYAGLL